MGVVDDFIGRQPSLEAVKQELVQEIRDVFEGNTSVDFVSGRVKSVEQFEKKASRQVDGKSKYSDPLREIQDQIGIRVVVKFLDQVGPAVTEIEKMFNSVETQAKFPENPELFGYEAFHLVLLVPPDLRAKHGTSVDFFELQVCTLFQHAWAEANHDIGYKPVGQLSAEQVKLKAWAAASAWSADRAFGDLRVELGQVAHS